MTGSGADTELLVSDDVPSEFVVVLDVDDEPSALVTVSAWVSDDEPSGLVVTDVVVSVTAPVSGSVVVVVSVVVMAPVSGSTSVCDELSVWYTRVTVLVATQLLYSAWTVI